MIDNHVSSAPLLAVLFSQRSDVLASPQRHASDAERHGNSRRGYAKASENDADER